MVGIARCRAAAAMVVWTWVCAWAGVPLVSQTACGVVTIFASSPASCQSPASANCWIWVIAAGVGGLTNCPLTACHCWFDPPLHVHHSMRVPLAELAPVMSRQPPSIWIVTLLATVQLCAAANPLHVNIWTLLPGVAAALLLSTHTEPLSPATIGPVAPVTGASE